DPLDCAACLHAVGSLPQAVLHSYFSAADHNCSGSREAKFLDSIRKAVLVEFAALRGSSGSVLRMREFAQILFNLGKIRALLACHRDDELVSSDRPGQNLFRIDEQGWRELGHLLAAKFDGLSSVPSPGEQTLCHLKSLDVAHI
ncbi:unnamed protein product, partial [Amoebophrya sp. A120]